MATRLNTQQRQINQVQQYHAHQQELYLQEWQRITGINIHTITPRQIRKVRRQRQRLEAKAKRLRRRDNAKS